MTKQELNAMVVDFFQRLGFVQLVNVGRSRYSSTQDILVQQIFDYAYEILVIAHNNKNTELFNRIYNVAVENIVPSEAAKSVMEYPEKYDNMVKSKSDFIKKVTELRKPKPQNLVQKIISDIKARIK